LITKHIYLGQKRICSKAVNSANGASYTHYYHLDHLGSSNAISDGSGVKVQSCGYKPYGESFGGEVVGGGEGASYLFGSKEFDETGLYYFNARYYDPKVGRFISPDPVNQDLYDPQNLNSYSYCRNNPLNLVDPTGESWQESWDYSWNYWNSLTNWNNFISTSSLSLSGFGQGIYSSIINTPSALWNSITDPVGTIKGIPEGIGQSWNAIMSGGADPYRCGQTIGAITGGIETSLALGWAVKGIKSSLFSNLSEKELINFSRWQASKTVLTETDTLYRAWGGPAPLKGHYWSKIKPASELQWRINQAVLPEWNSGKNLAILKIPKGKTIIGWEGQAAYKNDFFIGGGNQIYLQNIPDEWITSTQW